MFGSEREREIFESHGWSYDHVAREWRAPDGHVVTTDELMCAADVLGIAVERRVREVAAAHGRRSDGPEGSSLRGASS